jgi:regulator of sigma E protease
MSNLHEIVVATVAFFVLVGLMVVVHELGHFIVAKLCKVRVEAFSFGLQDLPSSPRRLRQNDR